MTTPFPEFDEFRALLDALCEESITAEQIKRLEELVLLRPEAEAYYVQFLSLHADLAGHFGVLPARAERSLRDRIGAGSPSETARPAIAAAKPARRTRRLRFLIAGAAGLSGLAAAALLLVPLVPRPSATVRHLGPPPEATDNTVAVLLHAPGAAWEDSGLAARPGAPLPPGWLRLKSGSAYIEFYSGATVILQGPAELRLISRTEAYCARGKLRAMVPPHAHGFTIGSPKYDLVDRGTEFGLDVAAGGQTEVHVFDGQVDLYASGTDRGAKAAKGLKTGQGVRQDGPGPARPIKSNSEAFLTAQELVRRSKAELAFRQREWQAASDALRKDRDLLVYYPFRQTNQPWDRTLPDQARERRQPRDGVIVGCQWVAGRWPGERGLEFKRVSDRVRFHVPGEFESLTLAAWVRVDALPNRNNSLMMADGWEPGELHWQIGDNGTIILGVQTNPKAKGGHYHAVGAFTSDRFGRWSHLAVVYDGGPNRQVTHYLDGKPVARQELLFDVPLRIGDAELGNWNVATHRNNTPVRFLTGCMDEFQMFARALDDAEIEKLHAQGRPPL